MRIYFLDSVDRIRSAEWLDCDVTDVHRLAADRLGEFSAVEVWRASEKLLRLEREPVIATH